MRPPKKPNGYCHNGHDQVKSGFIDSGGDWRCRECRKNTNMERDYWKLVKQYMENQSSDALEKLERFHWRQP